MSLTSQFVHKTATIEKRLEGMNRSEIQKRNQHAWSHACSTFLALPGLRGFWPMSAFGNTGGAFDQSGNSRSLTYNGNPTYNYDGLVPYIDLDGTGDYLSRADEAGLSITGTETYVAAGVKGLTCGSWVYSSDVTNLQFLIAKYGAAGSRSWRLELNGAGAGDPVRLWISDDGTNQDSVASTNGYSANAWYYVVGRFNDSDTGEELAIWLNSTKTTAATARASINDNASNFTIGSDSVGGNLLTGRVSMAFLCATALSDDIIAALYAQTRALFGV